MNKKQYETSKARAAILKGKRKRTPKEITEAKKLIMDAQKYELKKQKKL